MATEALHLSHPAIAQRLKRAEGISAASSPCSKAGRPCLELAQQLQRR